MAIVLPKFPRRRSPVGTLSSTQPAVNVTLCNEDDRYEAGGLLVAKWRISRVPIDQLQGLEVSVMWYTEGKGDEDLHVHHFHRLTEQQLRDAGIADEHSIQCRLPATPLSYHGKLITIRWSLRLRLFLTGGREILAERPFFVVARAHRENRFLFNTSKELPTRPMSNVVDWSSVVVPVGSVLRKPPLTGSSRSDATFTAS